MRLRIKHDEVTGSVDVSLYERREDGIMGFDRTGDRLSAMPVARGAEMPRTFSLTEEDLIASILDITGTQGY